MQPIEKAMEALIGREPTSAEIEKFYRIKDELGIGNHDAIWSILLALGHYETLYGEIPARIQHVTSELIELHKSALASNAADIELSVKNKLHDAVSSATTTMSQEIISSAKDAVGKLRAGDTIRTYLIAGGLIATLFSAVLGAVAWGSYELGAQSSHDVHAWRESKQGMAMSKFAELNNVEAMLTCPKPFERRSAGDGTYCIPYDFSGDKKIYGWRIK